MVDKTQDFKRTVEEGSIEQIQEFLLRDFHSIKHTESFAALLYRLKDEQWLRNQVVRKINKIQQDLYGLKDLLTNSKERDK